MTDKQTYKEMAVLLEKLQRTAGAMEFLLRGSFLDFTALQLPRQGLGDSCMGVTWPTHYIGTLRRAPVPNPSTSRIMQKASRTQVQKGR